MVLSRIIRKLACSTNITLPNMIPMSKFLSGSILTFDDGPDPQVTPLLLDLLSEYKIKAVFFILGAKIAGNEHIVNRIVQEGHILGNHSFNHNCLVGMGNEEFTRDVIDFQKTIDSFVSNRYRLFRPPQGLITLSQYITLIKNDIKFMYWNVDSRDSWLENPSDIAAFSAENVKGSGKILLFHDDAQKVVDALEILLSADTDFLEKISSVSEEIFVHK